MSSLAIWAEIGRALTDLVLLPPRAAHYFLRRRQLKEDARRDLDCPAVVTEPPELTSLPDRPLRVFVSCAEPSGQIHALNLVRELRATAAAAGAPPPEITALGGPALAELGVELVGDPVSRATMGFDVLSSLPFYMHLLDDAYAHMQGARPDVFLPVDSPALHVPLARLAQKAGVPVVHFVTPQYWGWAPWRVASYRRAVDLALCILPFEVPWFERHGVTVAQVGHPLLDTLRDIPRGDSADALASTDSAGTGLIALLPGSRKHVVQRNLPWMLRMLGSLRESLPDLDVVIPHTDAKLTPLLDELIDEAGARGWVRVESGDLHGILGRARTAFSVSGTVLLDLLHHRLPTVVVYRLANARQSWASRHFLTAPYFASVNLLAGREVYPEFCFDGQGPADAVLAALRRAHSDDDWRRDCKRELERAAERLGPPGAVGRAARHALAQACPDRVRKVGAVHV